jgi:hypothetical protein
VAGVWRKVQNEELRYIYGSSNIRPMSVVRSGRLVYSEHVAIRSDKKLANTSGWKT